MLILTRRSGESIVMRSRGPYDGEIKVIVLGMRGNQVRIGVDAPQDIEVWRDEILERIARQEAGRSR